MGKLKAEGEDKEVTPITCIAQADKVISPNEARRAREHNLDEPVMA